MLVVVWAVEYKNGYSQLQYICCQRQVRTLMNRIIFHIDVNSAFLSWEAAKRVKNGESDIKKQPRVLAATQLQGVVWFQPNQTKLKSKVSKQESHYPSHLKNVLSYKYLSPILSFTVHARKHLKIYVNSTRPLWRNSRLMNVFLI